MYTARYKRMFKYFLVLFVCCLCAGALSSGRHAAARGTKPVEVVVLFASHLAEMQERSGKSTVAELGHLLNELRAEHDYVLFLHGGNALGPSALSSLDKGAHMIGLLNLLEPVAMGTGRRDYMHKEDELFLRSREAIFPVVSSNIIDPLTQAQPAGLAKTLLIEEAGAVLGYAALVSPDIESTYIQERVRSEGGFPLLPGLSAELRDDGADFVIVSADFVPDNPEKTLAESGADLLLVTDAPEALLLPAGGKAYAQQGPERDVLLMKLSVTPGAGQNGRPQVELLHLEQISLAGRGQDAQVAELVQSYSQALESLMNIPVGELASPMDTTTRTIRMGENAFGNLVTDALREYYGADAAIVNAGGLRGNHVYEPGTVLTRRDLQTELPLHDTSCFMRVSGEVLWEALEHGVSQWENARGRFLQVSGISYSFDPAEAPGSRVKSVTVGGQPLQRDREYSLSLATYIGQHGDDFTMFSGVCLPDAPRPTQELLEIVRVYIANHSPVAPKLEGRIVKLP